MLVKMPDDSRRGFRLPSLEESRASKAKANVG